VHRVRRLSHRASSQRAHLDWPVTPPTNCSLPSDAHFGVGIYVNGQTDVKIEGRGVIQHFERWGILLLSSTEVTVRKVTANRNCWSGMQTIGTSESNFEEDIGSTTRLVQTEPLAAGFVSSIATRTGCASLHLRKWQPRTTQTGTSISNRLRGSSRENLVEDDDIGGTKWGPLF